MPDIKVAVVRSSTPTSTGTVDFTSSGFGTPKAAMFFLMFSPGADGTATQDDTCVSFGFTDGTRDRATSFSSEDAVTTTNTSRSSVHACAVQTNFAGTAVDKQGDFNSWITDGVRLDWTVTTGSQELEIVCVLFGGTDLQAYVGNMNSTTGTSTTGPGFKPDVVFASTSGVNSTSTSATAANTTHSLGCAVRGASDSITEAVVSSTFWDNESTSRVYKAHSSSDFAAQLNGTSYGWRASVSSWDVSGFTISTTGSPGSPADQIAFLALELGGASVTLLNDFNTGTATGNKAYTTSAKPQAIVGTITSLTSANANSQTTNAERWGWFAATSDAEFAQTIAQDDAVSTTVEYNMSDTEALALISATGTKLAVASLDSFNATDFTLNYSTAPASSLYGWAVAIEEGETAVSITVNDSSHSHAADQPAVTQTHEISVSEASHNHTVDEPVITQTHEITVDEALHAHTPDEPTVTQVHSIAVDDSSHTHVTDSPAITQTYVINVGDATHTHTADNATATTEHNIVVADATHSHTADNITVTVITVVRTPVVGELVLQPTLLCHLGMDPSLDSDLALNTSLLSELGMEN